MFALWGINLLVGVWFFFFISIFSLKFFMLKFCFELFHIFSCFVSVFNWDEFLYNTDFVNKIFNTIWDSCLFYYELRDFDSAILSLLVVEFVSRFDNSAAHDSSNSASFTIDALSTLSTVLKLWVYWHIPTKYNIHDNWCRIMFCCILKSE